MQAGEITSTRVIPAKAGIQEPRDGSPLWHFPSFVVLVAVIPCQARNDMLYSYHDDTTLVVSKCFFHKQIQIRLFFIAYAFS